MQKIIIVGATSAIAQESARIWAERGDHLVLVGRSESKLQAIQEDLRVRTAHTGALIETLTADLDLLGHHPALLQNAFSLLGNHCDLILVAHGTLGEQTLAQKSWEETQKILLTNFLGPVSLLTEAANRLENQSSGTLAVISSVAGDRGRQSNYIYGTAKGGLSIFLQGLRNRLFAKGVHVLTIKPGFVDTPMTASFKKGLLWAKPETVARGIVRACDTRRDVVYLPFFWRWIMLIITSIPEGIFKKLKL